MFASPSPSRSLPCCAELRLHAELCLCLVVTPNPKLALKPDQAGVYATFLADLFPTESRATGIGASYNLAFALFGGLCPILETLVWEAATGGGETRTSRMANSTPALLLVGVSAANVASCVLLRKLRAQGVLQRYLLGSSEPDAAEDALIAAHSREMDEICAHPENTEEGIR